MYIHIKIKVDQGELKISSDTIDVIVIRVGNRASYYVESQPDLSDFFSSKNHPFNPNVL